MTVYNLKTGTTEHVLEHQEVDKTCSFSPEGLLAVGDGAKKMTVYNLKTGTTEHVFEHEGVVRTCSFSPEGLLAVGDGANKMTVYNLKTGTTEHVFEHEEAVRTCSFSPEGLLAVGDAAKKMTVYNLKAVPLPFELPLCAPENIAYRKHLIHRRGLGGTTILHRLVNEGTTDQLKAFIDAVEHLVPVQNDKHATPLDLAIQRSDHPKAEMLLEKYVSHVPSGLSALCDVLKAHAGVFPDLTVKLLDGSKSKVAKGCTKGMGRLEVNSVQYKPFPSPHAEALWTADDKQKGGKEVSVTPYLVGFPGFLSQDGPFDAIVRSVNLNAFETDAMKYAVDYKWKTYGRNVQLFIVILYLTLFVIFTIGQLAHLSGNEYLSWLLVASVLSGVFLVEEVAQVYSDPVNYVSSGWNVIDICAYFMVILSTILRASVENNAVIPVVSGWTFIVLSVNFLNFLRPFDYFGSLIRMITQIFSDMKNFIVLQVIFLFGFTMCFMVMLANSEAFQGSMAFLTGYEMMLGDWDMGNFEAMTMKKINATTVAEVPDPVTTGFAILAFCLYMFLVPIVTMNLLIAIMGDSYDRVRDNEAVEGRLQKAEVLADMDRTWRFWLTRNETVRNRNYPWCFHALEPDGLDTYEDSEWEGRLKALRRTLLESDKKISAVDAKVDDLQKAMNEKLDAILKHLASAQDRI
jgi:hypothetical protein